ncbi:hypothetical protein [Metabacillus niabensis]|uniref:hypothetical protein n=1 Tax=Metabacillus niabensis TaxID=324854 RepID=UPI0011A9D502
MIIKIYLFLILIFISYLIATAIHEMGHAFFVKFTNNKVIELRLGKGKKDKYLFKIGDLEIKRLFFLSGSRCVWSFNNWDNYKKDGILISLGGCIANLVTVIATLPIGITLAFLEIKLLAYFFLLISSISGYQMLINLLPIKGYDGYNIIKYNSNSKEFLMKEQNNFKSKYMNEG